MSDDEASTGKGKQVYVRCNGKPLITTAAEVETFFAACGKPTSVLNDFGEAPVDGTLKKLVLVSFKKNKARRQFHTRAHALVPCLFLARCTT